LKNTSYGIPPTISWVLPTSVYNNSINNIFNPSFVIWNNDSDGDILTINWYSNVSGDWELYFTQNDVVANSTNQFIYDNLFDLSYTKYWVNVTVDDGIYNVSSWICFTTDNQYWILSDENPVNGSYDNPLELIWCVYINSGMNTGWMSTTICPYDPEEGCYYIEFEETCDETLCTEELYLNYGTNYTVYCNITDSSQSSDIWENETFWFWTVNAPRSWQQIDDWNITLKNINAWNIISNWNITLRNITIEQQIDDWNITLRNTTISQQITNWNITLKNLTNYQQFQDWNITLKNITNFQQIQDWNITLKNINIWNIIDNWNITLKNINSWNQINNWNITLRNITSENLISNWNITLHNIPAWTQIQDWNITLKNKYIWNQIQDWNITLRNISNTYLINDWNITLHNISLIIISNIYPSNNSINIPLQPVLYATINHTGGDIMNISWYYGDSLDNCYNLLGSDNLIYNSTQSELDFNASTLSTNYYWRIQVNDGINYINETYKFITEGYSGGFSYQPPSNSLWVLSLFGLVGIALWFIRRKKKKKIYYD
jgi:hypothetical protein